jgi:hypothetical protein
VRGFDDGSSGSVDDIVLFSRCTSSIGGIVAVSASSFCSFFPQRAADTIGGPAEGSQSTFMGTGTSSCGGWRRTLLRVLLVATMVAYTSTSRGEKKFRKGFNAFCVRIVGTLLALLEWDWNLRSVGGSCSSAARMVGIVQPVRN